MAALITELAGLKVTVDRLEYSPYFDGSPTRPHAFTYYITIHNDSDDTITIKGRKWVLTDENGVVMVYEGDGVKGEFPCLAPGQQYHYDSYHLIQAHSTAEGAYIGQNQFGQPVITRIPRFVMAVPSNSAEQHLAY